MKIWQLSLKNIKAKPLYSILSIITLSLSLTLLFSVKQTENSLKNEINNNLGDIDLVIGAKGSPSQLVLSSILYIDAPTGNIPFNYLETLNNNKLVKKQLHISWR